MISRREFLQAVPTLLAALKNLVLSDNKSSVLTGFPPGTGVEQAASGFPITFDWQFPDAATVIMEEVWYKIHLPVINSAIQAEASDRATFNGLQEQITTGFAPDFEPIITWEE